MWLRKTLAVSGIVIFGGLITMGVVSALIGRYLSRNKLKRRRPLLLSDIVKGLAPEVPQKEAFEVLTKMGESFGVQPELLRLEDSISVLTGMDSWRLGKGQEDFESWLRERGISKFEKMPSTVGELINVVVPKMSGSGTL